jgi:hypothetical protein
MRYRVTIDQTVRAIFYVAGESAEEIRQRVHKGDWGIDDPKDEGYNELVEDVTKWRLREITPVR